MKPSDHKNLGISAPSAWVTRFSSLIAGDVLDIACGSGRHVRFFLSRGHHVTAIDRDVSGLDDLSGDKRLEMLEIDLEVENAALPARQYGGVIVTNYLWRPLLPAIVDAVAPAGVLIYETFAVGNEAFGKPSNPNFLLKPGELLSAVSDRLRVIAYEDGITQQPQPAAIQRICAVGPDFDGQELDGPR